MKVLTQNIIVKKNNITLDIRREDLIHPFVSGNKFRKLKYNILEAKKQGKSSLLTFGGAFSNHIAAVAFAGKENNFRTFGIIRGHELETKIEENPTLKFAHSCGMQFKFISRQEYQNKNNPDFLSHLNFTYNNSYLIPEGGTNSLAIKGCEEILDIQDVNYNYICCAVGTGGTISGLINSSENYQKIIGFPALKGDFIQKDISKFAKKNNWELISDYHFGGYGKVSNDLILFINRFFEETKIPLDPIYTAKMVFGVMDLININYFPNDSKILLIHTGGIQGIEGMNNMLIKKNKQIININV